LAKALSLKKGVGLLKHKQKLPRVQSLSVTMIALPGAEIQKCNALLVSVAVLNEKFHSKIHESK